MKSLWSVATLGLSAGILLVFLTSPAEARHRIRMVENGYFNPTGGVNPRRLVTQLRAGEPVLSVFPDVPLLEPVSYSTEIT